MSDKNTEKTNSDKSLHAMMMSPSFMGSADASERSDFDLSKSSSNGLKDEQSGTTATEGVTATTSKDALAAEEAKAVALLKRLLVIFLSCVTIGATVATYFLARDYQTDEFQFQFSANKFDIQQTVGQRWKAAQGSSENLATSIVSAGVASGHFDDLSGFQMPLFKKHTEEITGLSSGVVLAVGWAPAVLTPKGLTWPIVQMEKASRNMSEADEEFVDEVIANFWAGLASDGEIGDNFYYMVFTQGVRPKDFWYFSFNYSTPERYAIIIQPIAQENSEAKEEPIVTGMTFTILSWDAIFQNVLGPDSGKTVVVLEDTCDKDGYGLTYELDGQETTFLGNHDLHDASFDDMEETIELKENSNCQYIVRVFPSKDLEMKYETEWAWLYALIVFCVMLLFLMVFGVYDIFIQRRQQHVLAKAARSNAIVTSLFPSNVRSRILKDAEDQVNSNAAKKLGTTGKSQLKSYLEGGEGNRGQQGSKPIADLFPATTVMFGDIAGFTAWSSIREPCQVFSLLETLYNAFDDIAKRRRVYKVETIGDCYVAVTGLPEPRKDHAIAMTRFAKDVLKVMNTLTRELETELGPETGDLQMRIGLHSGPVTAGVLRGNNCRFQLFGDTVNTAARMESHGKRDAIHVSEETANLLKEAGKEDWLLERTDKIFAKGKGELTTYFITLRKGSQGPVSVVSASSESQNSAENSNQITASSVGTGLNSRLKRLVTFNSDLLARLIKSVVARREAIKLVQGGRNNNSRPPLYHDSNSRPDGNTVLDEAVDILTLPTFNAKAAAKEKDPKEIELSEEVIKQIHQYITVIASMYRREVPFHNFEHASHVTMSISKLLSRIVSPDAILSNVTPEDEDKLIKQLHDHTYGITSDPLTQFAAVLSGLIHDVDHTGLPNAQLVKEGNPLATAYKNKSVAEQNSIDLAWDLLMADDFKDLRAVIYTNEAEEKHFRALLVNLVLATDICDKELGAKRKERWAKAFAGTGSADHINEPTEDAVNRKATIVLEHLIQASDVAHTMQHWHIYRKWNEKLFEENMKAFRAGRAEKNPAEYWYKGEIGFFDFYIIPLVKKLKECGVFGVSSEEYLDYAMKNRAQWEQQGEAIVQEMVDKYLPAIIEEEEDLSDNEDDASEGTGSFDSSSALNLDSDVIVNVTESWELLRRIENHEEKTGTILFSVLFEKCPPSKVLFGFPIGMDPESEGLRSSKRFLMHARYLVQMLDKSLQLIGPDSEVLAEILHELGKKHVRLGVKENFFPIMGEALMEALHTLLGAKFTKDMKESWAIVYDALSGEMIKAMNNDKAVISSWNRLKSIENYQEVAGVILFQKLFLRCPDAKLLFGYPADLDTHSESFLCSRRFKGHSAYFIEMLDKALDMVEAKEIGDNMKRLGEMHVQFGVKDEYFPVMGEALIETLKEVLKAAWNQPTEDAWRDVYGRLSSGMIEAMQKAMDNDGSSRVGGTVTVS